MVDFFSPTTLYELVCGNADRHPNAVAIMAPQRRALTFARLREQVTDTIQELASLGIEHEDRVAVVIPNGPEMAVAFLAITSYATCTPLNPAYRLAEFQLYLSAMKVKAVVVQAGIPSPAIDAARALGIRIIELIPSRESEAGLFVLKGDHVPHAKPIRLVEPNDIALILHTSGTTAQSKLVPLTQANLCAIARNHKNALQLSEQDRYLNIVQLFVVGGICCLTSALLAGGSVFCTPGFYVSHFFEWMDECRPTWYGAVPSMLQAIVAHADENSEIIARNPLRLIRSGAAYLPPQLIKRLESVFHAPVIETYGLTEASTTTVNPLPPLPRKVGSVGIPAGTQVAIMDEMGNLMPPGTVGEIVIRGEHVMHGYLDNPEANAQVFRNGWLRSGDLGYLDADGYVFITGRIKEQINRGGQKVSPREVEEVLLDHPAIAQVVAFPVPDARLGEEVAVAVVLRQGELVSARALREFAALRLADFKVPQQIVFVKEIPLGATGKIERIRMAEKLGLTSAPLSKAKSVYIDARTPTEASLVEIWKQVLGLERVGVQDDLMELGGDSMLATLIVSRVREIFQVELSLIAIFESPTIAQLAQLIEQASRKTQADAITSVPRDGRRAKRNSMEELSQ